MSFLELLHGGYVHKRRVSVLSEWCSNLIPRNASVLDVGCGDGRHRRHHSGQCGLLGAAGENVSNRCYIGYIRGRTVGNGDGINVIIDSSGQLGTSNSSRRFKKDIRPMDQISEAVLALRPVTFHYRNQDTKRAEDAPQFGLIAEDV